jgi:hypothetical protein
MSRSVAAAKPLVQILETEWDAYLFRGGKSLSMQTGWTSYHTLRSRGSKAGFPDRVLFRERIVYVELKREKGAASPISDFQKAWLDGLSRAGGEVYLWRPSDLDEAAKILGRRWTFVPWDPADPMMPPSLWAKAGDASWSPGSIWIPTVGRNDAR